MNSNEVWWINKNVVNAHIEKDLIKNAFENIKSYMIGVLKREKNNY